jgi:hypothetical protein
MTDSTRSGFERFISSLAPIGRAKSETFVSAVRERVREPTNDAIRAAADYFVGMSEVDVQTLAATLREHPHWVPALGLVAGLSHERLKNELRHRFGTTGWIKLAATRSLDIVEMLDGQYGVVGTLRAEQKRQHTLADVLAARAGSRVSAGGAIKRGRGVEDQLESLIQAMQVPYEFRTQFTGRGGCIAPCDLAIPHGGAGALIVCAAKGFNSTGSKLTDAVREVLAMADCRMPTQYVFAVIDGIGWLSRQADLRRIYDLYVRRMIDGLYSLSMLDEFRVALQKAIAKLDIPPAQ